MKKFYFLSLTVLISALSFGQQIVFFENFQDDGNGTVYNTSVPEFSDGSGDFFTRTDGSSNITSTYQIFSDDNDYYFAAMDTDGDGQPSVLTMDFDDIDISGFTNMTFVIGLAEDDSEDGNEDWDADSSFTVEVDYDNSGSFTKILQFEAIGGTNTEPAQDTDFDGVGDGTFLTNEWGYFQVALATGSLIDIRLTFSNLDAGDEDIAIDLVAIAEDIDLFPGIEVTSPYDYQVFPPGTTSVDIVFGTQNQQPSDRVDIIINGNLITDITSPYTIATTDGQDYDCQVILTDGTDNLDDYYVFFSVSAINQCFDLSGGTELLESVTVMPNSEGDEWTETSGTYTMNGYVGGGSENVETWLIFGPLDTTSATDLVLEFDAAKLFDDTDLNIVYTSSYFECPSNSAWTTAQVIDTAGSYSVDLSGAILGPDVFIGIQYMDDGLDGYAEWRLSNVSLGATGACPTLGSRPTSNCPALSLSENKIDGFKVYPNPSSKGQVTILSNSFSKMNITVTDMLGKLVLNKTVTDNTMDVSTLKSGIYVMKVAQDGATSTQKLVIK
ncbi:T9SS type A sorting domain-containing protein [Flavobacteriaceae bacterium SZ-1-7]|uniref:T9SS type A sorting domain-containing protein n=1 Tax=Tamlana sedimenti TaxID=3134126 RepID=UPI003128EEDF